MWTRAMLKMRAKEVLRISYWKAFLVSLVIAFAGGNSNGFSPGNIFNLKDRNSSNRFNFSRDYMDSGSVSLEEVLAVVLVVLGVFAVIFLFALAFRVLLGYPLEVGGKRYFIQAQQNDIKLNYLTSTLKSAGYMGILQTMLWRALLNFLWYLLFLIPGIVKSYAYQMVPYILADNPKIGYRRAVQLSNQMTQGHKFDMWVLDLSFLGWYLLGALALGVGVLFVTPYHNATKAELYLTLRNHSIEKGICTCEELMLRPMFPKA